MIKPLTDLTPTELRIRCAEQAVGLKIKQLNDGSWLLVDGDDFQLRIGPKECCIYGLPAYDTDRNALMELIQAVPEEKREWFLFRIFYYSPLGSNDQNDQYKMNWLYLTAPPEAIMRAFLTVMEEE